MVVNKNRDFSCKICKINEAVLEIKGSGFLSEIQGEFCQPCGLVRIRDYYKWTPELEKGLGMKQKVDLVNDSFKNN